MATIRDRSSWMTADSALLESPHRVPRRDHPREQLELVLRCGDIGLWHRPLPFGELVWDEKAKEHFHLPPDARVTMDTFYERLHPSDRERTRTAIETSIASGEVYDVEFRTVSPDGGSVRWIQATGRAYYDDDGTPVRFDGVTRDVSERTRAELALREKEERYRLATRATNDLIWDLDFDTQDILWNAALEDRFGYPLTRATANVAFWIDHIHPEDRTRVVEGVYAVIGDPTQEHWHDEYRFERADGTYVDVLDRGYVLRDASGRAVRMIGAMQDLTDRKRAEHERERMLEAERNARSEAERQSRMKDEFLAGLSHELRTPLNAIVGWAHLLRSRLPTDSDTQHGLEVIARNAQAQARMVDELLDMSRLIAGKVALKVEPVDAAAAIAAAIETVRPAADVKRVELAARSAPGCWISCDLTRLQQVLWNLLSNALKFTPTGGRIDVVVERGAAAATIRVTDTGEGIRPDFLPSVFERFRQADASSTRQHGGLGLGLAIVKQLVELHGGSVTAESPGVGQGSTFTVALPLVAPPAIATGADLAPSDGEAQDREPGSGVPPPAAIDVDLSALRVLVVDDDADSRALIARLLEERGAKVALAASSEQGVGVIANKPFDVLVSDIGMPREDGYTFLRRVRALGKERGGDIPAIAATAYAREADRVRALAGGFSRHIAKPIDPAELAMAVASVAAPRASAVGGGEQAVPSRHTDDE
jgi:PAS domain S-box-containing protein